jgi:DNA-directed RNA polymerase specialized sigma24 family protein
MLDDTPAPFGDVTRRWARLDDDERDRHVARLVGGGCSSDQIRHVEIPGVDDGACYLAVVVAALGGDPVALGWIATTHRPLLISHGRAILERDPSEWGAVCFEQLHRALVRADLTDATWLRRRIARQLIHRLGGIVANYLGRCRREEPVEPALLRAHQAVEQVHGDEVDDRLAAELARLLSAMDIPDRDGLYALAEHVPLYEIAERHNLSYGALRQRVTRARRHLRTELAPYRRAAV